MQFDYLYTAANLYAFMLKLEPVRDKDVFKRLLVETNIQVPEWKPNTKFLTQVKSEVESAESQDKEKKPILHDDEVKIKQLTDELNAYDISHCIKLEPADFEKDDDTNFHIDYITACSNTRAWNYEINAATRHKCKMIAGKIIPAVATTTAMVTGLVEIEILKYILGLEKNKFLCANANLGLGQLRLFEPVAPKKAVSQYDVELGFHVKPIPDGFTIWDKVVINHGDLTIKELVTLFPEIHHGCKIDNIFFKQKKKNRRKRSTFSNLGQICYRSKSKRKKCKK